MNVIESLLKRPFFSASIYSGVMLALFGVFGVMQIIKTSANPASEFSGGAIFFNLFIVCASIVAGFLPGVAARLFSAKCIWERIGSRNLTATILTVFEIGAFIVMLNLLMNNMVSGAIGTAALFLVLVLLLISSFFWIVIAVFFYFFTKNRPLLPLHNAPAQV